MSRLPPAAKAIDRALREARPDMAEADVRRIVAAACEAMPGRRAPSSASVRLGYAQADRDAKLRDLSATLPVAALARRFGLSERQVYRILGRRGR